MILSLRFCFTLCNIRFKLVPLYAICPTYTRHCFSLIRGDQRHSEWSFLNALGNVRELPRGRSQNCDSPTKLFEPLDNGQGEARLFNYNNNQSKQCQVWRRWDWINEWARRCDGVNIQFVVFDTLLLKNIARLFLLSLAVRALKETIRAQW